MCRMELPGSDGLNGAMEPYGRGNAISSGIYALGRGTAVVCSSP
eukprot:CAMPEP_0196734638 /NCGR_PEP_ID=MMETSP1091-20130531/13311_1 /TAXON_ID=302021 /ORGANISM="Rhodomonas sp., Strain CCMP768" /LENGTH=43 /DNA_ID= /DNA_START= /DNA_END= /DNA_ORIENTATION=